MPRSTRRNGFVISRQLPVVQQLTMRTMIFVLKGYPLILLVTPKTFVDTKIFLQNKPYASLFSHYSFFRFPKRSFHHDALFGCLFSHGYPPCYPFLALCCSEHFGHACEWAGNHFYSDWSASSNCWGLPPKDVRTTCSVCVGRHPPDGLLCVWSLNLCALFLLFVCHL